MDLCVQTLKTKELMAQSLDLRSMAIPGLLPFRVRGGYGGRKGFFIVHSFVRTFYPGGITFSLFIYNKVEVIIKRKNSRFKFKSSITRIIVIHFKMMEKFTLTTLKNSYFKASYLHNYTLILSSN